MNKISHRVCVIDMVRNVFKQFGFSASPDAGNDFDVWRLQHILYFHDVISAFYQFQFLCLLNKYCICFQYMLRPGNIIAFLFPKYNKNLVLGNRNAINGNNPALQAVLRCGVGR